MSGVKILGVDPGKGGGLALLCPYDGILLEPMPIDAAGEFDLAELARLVGGWSPEIRFAVVEKVHGGPVGGRQKGSSGAFNFGKVYGAVLGVLASCGVSVHHVAPQTWMRAIHTTTHADSKERSLHAFLQLFPDIDARETARSRNQHMGMVEALLIAEYGRRVLA